MRPYAVPGRLGPGLAALAEQDACGFLDVAAGSYPARIGLRVGHVIAVRTPGDRERLLRRLVTHGLDPVLLADIEASRRRDLPQWTLGELLVGLGHLDQATLSTVVMEQRCDDVARLLGTADRLTFRPQPRPRGDGGPALTVADLLTEAARRTRQWSEVAERVGGPDAELRACRGEAADGPAGAVWRSCAGGATLRVAAESTGLTLLAAARLAVELGDAKLVDVTSVGGASPYEPTAADVEAAADSLGDQEVEPDPEPVTPIVPAPSGAADDATDTAALMRELSSLGQNDDPAPTRSPTAAAAPPSDGRRRRGGFFGR